MFPNVSKKIGVNMQSTSSNCKGTGSTMGVDVFVTQSSEIYLTITLIKISLIPISQFAVDMSYGTSQIPKWGRCIFKYTCAGD